MKDTAKTRILARLKQGPATTADLASPAVGGVRFGARLQELRDAGWHISEQRVRASSHKYTLLNSRPVALTWPGPFKACYACGHRWDEADRATECPACKSDLCWIEEHVTSESADLAARAVDVLAVARARATSRRRAEADLRAAA